jgi:hypothetical protein
MQNKVYQLESDSIIYIIWHDAKTDSYYQTTIDPKNELQAESSL